MPGPIRRREFLATVSALTVGAALPPRDGLLHAAPRVAQAPPSAGPRRFSLAYLTLPACPPPQQTYIAHRAGYDFVSLRPIPLGLPNEPLFELARNPRLRQQTRTALSSTGVRLHDIELVRIVDGTDPRSFVPALEVGAELGARHVISSIWTKDRGFATECYAQVCDLAKPLGLTVDLEFVTYSEAKTLQDAMEVLRAAKRENCGVLVDALHFSRSRVTLPELDAIPREWVHFAHVCDGPAEIPATVEELTRTAREARLYPGEGGIDVAAILRRLPDVPYSIEIPHLARIDELGYAEHAFRCLEKTKAYLAGHGLA